MTKDRRKKPTKLLSADLPLVTDDRFSRIHVDPRFRPIRRNKVRVKIDKRFKEAVQGNKKDFSSGLLIDKYGRPAKKTEQEDLSRFYELEDEPGKALEDSDNSGNDDEICDSEKKTVSRKVKKNIETVAQLEDITTISSGNEKLDTKSLIRDPAREAGVPSLSEEEDDESSEEEEQRFKVKNSLISSSAEDFDDPEDGFAADGDGRFVYDVILDREDIPSGDPSTRLAVVNADWDKIKAADLYKAFHSILPAGAQIHGVCVYISEFGRERIENEKQFGPQLTNLQRDLTSESKQNTKQTNEQSSEEDSEDDDLKINQEKSNNNSLGIESLRRYQLERMRYYYAIVTCGSCDVAKNIYNRVDGTEYECSGTFFDLRFVPDNVEFDKADVVGEATGLQVDYEPAHFENRALQHSQVKLSWDEDAPERVTFMRRVYEPDAVRPADFSRFLGSDDSDDEDETEIIHDSGKSNQEINDSKASKREAREARAQKNRLILLGNGPKISPIDMTKNNKYSSDDSDQTDDDYSESDTEKTTDKVGDMEITFRPGLVEAQQERLRERENKIRIENETTIEKYVRKLNEKKQKRLAASHEKKENEEEQLHQSSLIDNDSEEAEEKQNRKRRRRRKSKKKASDEGASDSDNEGANFSINVEDQRFDRVLKDHEYAIDPNNPHFKDSTNMQLLLSPKRKQRKDIQTSLPNHHQESSRISQLETLVESAKRKSAIALQKLNKGFGKRTKIPLL